MKSGKSDLDRWTIFYQFIGAQLRNLPYLCLFPIATMPKI